MPPRKTTLICSWVGVAVTALILSGAPVQAAPANPVEDRIDSLLGQMTLDEKISLLGGGGFSTMAVPRLGIPKLLMSDGPQGVRNYGKACMFPAGVALAATWDTALAERYGRGIGLEARARGVHIMLGPGVNISRLPVNGRNFEYFGEDPFLTSKVASRWISGMQNEGVIATVKHFAGNNQETERTQVDVRMDDRTLHEIYLPAFRSAVEESHVWAVMSAYNRFRENYCCGSDFLQNKILKDEFGFKGTLMSDWGACHAPSNLAAGLDLEMARGISFSNSKIKEALTKGEVQPQHIDEAVRRLLRAAISMGFLDRDQKRTDIALDSPASSRTALDVARSGIVLLKNDRSILPLDRTKTRRIAVYGPNACRTPTGGGGSGGVSPFHTVDYIDGIRALSGSNIEIVRIENPEPAPDEADHFPLVLTEAGGPAGFKLTAKTRNPDKTIDFPVQAGLKLSWKAGELPFGVDAESADFQFSGVLVAKEDSAWEVFGSSGRYDTKAEVGGVTRRLVPGDVIHVKKGQPLPIVVHHRFNRADTKTSQLQRWIVIRKPQLPDLTEAKKADVVIICGGFKTIWDTEESDRDFEMPETQNALIRAIAEVNPRVIVTVNSGAGVGMSDWIDKAQAVLETWYLGQEGGTALGEVLFGDINPSGRLPSTFGRTFTDYPAASNYPGKPEPGHPWPVVHYNEGIFVGYRGFDKADKKPLFPFGYGLSYTAFDYSDLAVKKTEDGSARVTLKVKNTGARAGSEVVQVYVGQPKCTVERPIRELKGFTKVPLKPGETTTVEILLPQDSFAFWHPGKRAWTVEPGSFTIEVGKSSRNILLKSNLTIDQPVAMAARVTQPK